MTDRAVPVAEDQCPGVRVPGHTEVPLVAADIADDDRPGPGLLHQMTIMHLFLHRLNSVLRRRAPSGVVPGHTPLRRSARVAPV